MDYNRLFFPVFLVFLAFPYIGVKGMEVRVVDSCPSAYFHIVANCNAFVADQGGLGNSYIISDCECGVTVDKECAFAVASDGVSFYAVVHGEIVSDNTFSSSCNHHVWDATGAKISYMDIVPFNNNQERTLSEIEITDAAIFRNILYIMLKIILV